MTPTDQPAAAPATPAAAPAAVVGITPRTAAQIQQQCRVFLYHQALRKGISPLIGDQNIRGELRRRAEWERFFDEGGQFLSTFNWDVFATPTFKHPVTEGIARRAVEQFVRGFGSQAYAAVAYEVGPVGLRTHAHLLLGGLNGVARGVGYHEWRQRGNIDWQQYDPKRGAAWYLMKTAATPDTLEYYGELKRWHRNRRPRRKGGKQQNV